MTEMEGGCSVRVGAGNSDLPEWWPFCQQCQKPVESVSVDPVIVWEGPPDNYRQARSTDTVVTVECHGEKWSISRNRGPLSPSDIRIP